MSAQGLRPQEGTSSTGMVIESLAYLLCHGQSVSSTELLHVQYAQAGQDRTAQIDYTSVDPPLFCYIKKVTERDGNLNLIPIVYYAYSLFKTQVCQFVEYWVQYLCMRQFLLNIA